MALSRSTFQQVLADAVEEMSRTGYASEERVQYWSNMLREAANYEMGSNAAAEDEVRHALESVFSKFVEGGGVLKHVPQVPRFTLMMVKPKLRAELDRRIAASADLIVYNRKAAVEATVKRFAGWSTSIPIGGDSLLNRTSVKVEIAAPVGKEKYHARLVANDQGHKLISNVAAIVAVEAGAIAGKWNSHFRDASYNAREEHADRDGRFYVVKGSWADEAGLLEAVEGHTEDITAPGQEVNCRCWYTWVTSPRALPAAMLTKKGTEWVERGNAYLARKR